MPYLFAHMRIRNPVIGWNLMYNMPDDGCFWWRKIYHSCQPLKRLGHLERPPPDALILPYPNLCLTFPAAGGRKKEKKREAVKNTFTLLESTYCVKSFHQLLFFFLCFCFWLGWGVEGWPAGWCVLVPLADWFTICYVTPLSCFCGISIEDWLRVFTIRLIVLLMREKLLPLLISLLFHGTIGSIVC